MYNFLPILLVVLSLAGLVVIFSRNLPRIKKSQDENEPELNTANNALDHLKGKIAGYLTPDKIGRVKYFFLNLLEKLVHRLRVMSLRTDNFLTRLLHDIRVTKKPELVNLKEENNIIRNRIASNDIGAADDIFKDIDVSTDLEIEEKRFLDILGKNNTDLEAIKNLARLYIHQLDLSSARMVLIQAYRIKPDDPIIESLFIDIREKEEKTPA